MSQTTRCSMKDRIRRGFAHAGSFASRLAAKLGDQLETVVQERRRHWDDVRNEPVPIADINTLIDSYANKNALIAASAGFVPGPFGLVVALPEIGLIIRNQVAMICDIAAAYGHQRVISKELVLGILLSSTSGGGLGILTMYGEKWVLKKNEPADVPESNPDARGTDHPATTEEIPYEVGPRSRGGYHGCVGQNLH